MKIKVIIAALAVVCLGLGVAFFATKQQGDEQHKKDVDSLLDFSNQLVGVNVQLDDLRQVNLALTNDLAANQNQLSLSKSELTQLSNDLATASATLTSTKSTLANAQDQITNLNSRIADLESQNKVLDQRATDLTTTIAQLNAQIETTKDHLAIARTNAAYLQQELQKQLAQRAELEHKFNDIDELRAQVKKIHDELFVARRLQLMKNDTGSRKGAELLLHPNTITNAPARAPKLPTNYDLNVEVGSDGSVRVIPPAPPATNSTAR